MDKHSGFGRADPRGGVFFPVIYPGSLQRQPAFGEAPWKAARPEAWQENPPPSPKQESFDIPGVRNGGQGEGLAQLLGAPTSPSGFKSFTAGPKPLIGSLSRPCQHWAPLWNPGGSPTPVPPSSGWVPRVESVPVGKSLPPL